MSASHHASKTRILAAAVKIVRSKGYVAMTIDEVCQLAGLTKGSFFHHFKTKEELGLAAVGHFSELADNAFAQAPYRAFPDPLARLLGYIDFRIELLRGSLPEFTCFLGTVVQETYETHPALRDACNTGISAHAADVQTDISLAKGMYVPLADWTAEGLAFHTQAVIQGAFILAKAKNGPEIAAACLMHLRRYLELLFQQPGDRE